MSSVLKLPRSTGAVVAGLMLVLAAGVFSLSALAAAEPAAKEATLELNFRPILTFRASLAGLTPQTRAKRAYDRINRMTPAQMLQPIEVLAGIIDNGPGLLLYSGEVILFSVLTADLDPEEKLTLQEAADQARTRLAEALRLADEQRLPVTIIKEVGWAALATLLAFSLLWLIWHAKRLLIASLQLPGAAEDAARVPRLRHHIWVLVQRLAQLVMGFCMAECRLRVADLCLVSICHDRTAGQQARVFSVRPGQGSGPEPCGRIAGDHHRAAHFVFDQGTE